MTNKATGPRPAPGILDIAPYVGGQSSLPGVGEVIKLSSNESPLGPSPAAIEAYHAAAGELALYPDGEATALKAAIAEVHGLEPERLFIGSGSDEILSLIAQAYLVPGDETVSSEHGFLVYRIATLANGGRPIVAPERRLTGDVDAILERVGPRTRIVFLANPNNPTGTYLSAAEIERLHSRLPGDVLLVLDAAYAEYVARADYEAGAALVRRAGNVIMTRTFSKIYGLAALRLGWAYGPPAVLGALNRIRGPFNASRPAQAAGRAAVFDKAFIAAAKAHNDEWRAFLADRITRLGIAVTESVGNFLLLDFSALGGNAEGAAAAADTHLKQRGLILRGVAAYGLPNCLRLTVGSAAANQRVVEALESFVGRAGAR